MSSILLAAGMFGLTLVLIEGSTYGWIAPPLLTIGLGLLTFAAAEHTGPVPF